MARQSTPSSSLLSTSLGALAITAGVLSGGCSLIFHADASQCSTTGDCQARGAAFAGYTCDKGSCVQPIASNDGGPDSAAPQCKTNLDCPADPSGFDVACDVGTGNCLTLTSNECPQVLGDITSTLAPPIFIGAYIVVPAQGGSLSHPSTLNFEMALNEFASIGGGIPAGPGTGRRTPVAIACNIAADVTTTMNHLINDVHVPVIVSALSTATLATVFSQYDNATPSANVFFMNAYGTNSTLQPPSLTTNGLLWSMLGAPGDVAPAYDAFLPLLQNYMQQVPPWNLTRPLKVAFVTSQATDLLNLAKAVKDTITWNGGLTVAQNHANGNELDYVLNNSSLNGALPADIANEAVSVGMQIAMDAPDVIVSFASEEFTQLASNIELDWPGGQTLPFYIVGPYNYQSTQFAATTKEFAYSPSYNSMQHRLAGIGIANSNDPTAVQVYSDYQTRYTAFNTGSTNIDTTESNYYDAMYYAVYSLIGAGRMTVGGSDVSLGMRDLIVPPPAAQLTMGPDSIGDVYKALGNGDKIGLVGTVGPPDFNVGTGSRVTEGDVYCILPPNGAGVSTYASDVLRLGDAGPDGSPFTGTFPCYPGLQ
jgi:hypothetical protein